MLREMAKKVLGKDAEIFRKKCQSEHVHDGFDNIWREKNPKELPNEG